MRSNDVVSVFAGLIKERSDRSRIIDGRGREHLEKAFEKPAFAKGL